MAHHCLEREDAAWSAHTLPVCLAPPARRLRVITGSVLRSARTSSAGTRDHDGVGGYGTNSGHGYGYGTNSGNGYGYSTNHRHVFDRASSASGASDSAGGSPTLDDEAFMYPVVPSAGAVAAAAAAVAPPTASTPLPSSVAFVTPVSSLQPSTSPAVPPLILTRVSSGSEEFPWPIAEMADFEFGSESHGGLASSDAPLSRFIVMVGLPIVGIGDVAALEAEIRSQCNSHDTAVVSVHSPMGSHGMATKGYVLLSLQL